MSSILGKTYLKKHMNRLAWFQEDENNSKKLGKYVLEKTKLKPGL